jgi:hypothetical protein
MNTDLQELRNKCPLPVLMGKLGLGRYAKSSCPSPFRSDENASWGIFERNGRWMFKDFGTGECGDEIQLLAHLYQADAKRDFLKLVRLYEEWAKSTSPAPAFSPHQKSQGQKPDLSFLREGSDEQIKKLFELGCFIL